MPRSRCGRKSNDTATRSGAFTADPPLSLLKHLQEICQEDPAIPFRFLFKYYCK
ncbi:MAG: hypothetical protein H7A47_06925 [Verrucomicrobiales bacterium]|nr:hypothetical protein [Verrucomicrobiales bacterium]